MLHAQGEVKTKYTGGLATLQCDGWKDVSKLNLIAFMFTASQTVCFDSEFNKLLHIKLISRQVHITNVRDVSSDRKTAENLIELIKNEPVVMENEYHLQVIGICTDASGESHCARLRLLREMPWLLIANCWAHQLSHLTSNCCRRFTLC